MFKATDADGSGAVSFEEFCALSSNKALKKEKLRAIFDALDVNRDGVLSLEEFSVWEQQVSFIFLSLLFCSRSRSFPSWRSRFRSFFLVFFWLSLVEFSVWEQKVSFT